MIGELPQDLAELVAVIDKGRLDSHQLLAMSSLSFLEPAYI